MGPDHGSFDAEAKSRKRNETTGRTIKKWVKKEDMGGQLQVPSNKKRGPKNSPGQAKCKTPEGITPKKPPPGGKKKIGLSNPKVFHVGPPGSSPHGTAEPLRGPYCPKQVNEKQGRTTRTGRETCRGESDPSSSAGACILWKRTLL